MSVYRDNAAPAPVVLAELTVVTARGHALVVFLAVIGMLLGVAGGVTVFAGAPPGIEGWKWPMCIGGAVFLAAAYAVHRTRRRRLAITREGDRRFLTIARENVLLELPVQLSGDQLTIRMNGVPQYTVFLKAIDASGRAVVFKETRGAIYGQVTPWFTVTERTTSAPLFETTSVDMVVQLRDLLSA